MPNWSPEGPQGLSGALDPNALEESSCKLWSEFLSGYFDGQQHGLIGYPQAAFAFQQRPFPQEINGIGIRIVGNVPGATKPRRDGSGQFVLANQGAWTFLTVAKVTGNRADGQNSDSLVRIASDLLYALFLKYDRLMPLCRAGFSGLKARPPVLAQSVDYAARKMMVHGVIRTVVEEQYTGLMVGDGELLVGDNGEVLRVG